MASNDHVTKADLSALRGELKAEQQVFLDKTKVLASYYNIADSALQRISEWERIAGVLTERMAIIERRLLELEKRINFPHAP